MRAGANVERHEWATRRHGRSAKPRPWAPDDVAMATNHRTGVVEIPKCVEAFWTDEMRCGLWEEAWEAHK